MTPSDAEIQVLASLQRAEIKEEPTDRASLEKGGERYWIYLEDWSTAFSSLSDNTNGINYRLVCAQSLIPMDMMVSG